MNADVNSAMDLQLASHHCRLLADPTRLRLLLLLDQEEMSVAELAGITQLAQPRVSTHLAKLKEAGLVADRRDGVFVYYRITDGAGDTSLEQLWQFLRKNTADPLLRQDLDRIPRILNQRKGAATWADSVAGDMERHYSPGRTWEACWTSLPATASWLNCWPRPRKALRAWTSANAWWKPAGAV
jgi:ArsR family transcriptional regulator